MKIDSHSKSHEIRLDYIYANVGYSKRSIQKFCEVGRHFARFCKIYKYSCHIAQFVNLETKERATEKTGNRKNFSKISFNVLPKFL